MYRIGDKILIRFVQNVLNLGPKYAITLMKNGPSLAHT